MEKIADMANELQFSQAVSDSGQFLFFAHMYGQIASVDIKSIRNYNDPLEFKFHAQKLMKVNALGFHDGHLIVGGRSTVQCLSWNEDNASLNTEPQWKVELKQASDSSGELEILCMWVQSNSKSVFVGCTNRTIYQIMLELGCVARCYSGHGDFVEGLSGWDGQKLFSTCKDGVMRIWSENVKDCVGQLEPHQYTQISRPNYGKWLRPIAAAENCVLCGGAPMFAVYDTRSLGAEVILPFSAQGSACDFITGNIIVAGNTNQASVYSRTGDLISLLELNNNVPKSIVSIGDPVKLISMAGNRMTVTPFPELISINNQTDV